MKKSIFPCLWFDGNAAEAAEFYCSIFSNSKISTNSPVVVEFMLEGQKFMGLNGGSIFTPNPSISFFVVFEDKKQTDKAWNMLSNGGKILMPLDKYDWSDHYGWVQDKYNINWQLATGNHADVGQVITPSLLFTKELAGKAEQAVHFYTSVFEGSSIAGILKYGAGDKEPEGNVKHAQFTLGNTVLMAMDSSIQHEFTFNEGVSLVVECSNQAEIDYFWNTLTENGSESMCGWLKDQYGVSWQIIPAEIGKWMSNPQTAKHVMDQILKMKKIEIAPLAQIYECR